VNGDYLIAPRFGFTKDILMKIQPAAIALLSLMAMQSARAEETASMSEKLMLTNEDVRSVAPPLQAYTQSRLLGDLWKRPGLAPRDRSIVTLAALIARNQTIEMPLYFNLALDNGVKPREISEIITHLAFYSGWGNAMSAISVARDVFAARHVGVDQLPAVSVTLLPLNEATEAQRSNAVQERFGSSFPGMVQYTTDVLFRDLWLRPDLAPRDRSLVTVSALIANGQTAQLTPHLNRAMDNGLTQAEAAEAITHLAFYVGWPNVFSAMPVAKDVFARMYWGKDVPTDEPDYFESQFELLMRVLVGRVDDGSAQARDPAVFVPAIFVDNPWSKLIGREYQGFEKRMARFLDKNGDPVLSTSSNGRGTGSRLFDIAGIEQVASLAPRTPGIRIADIDLPPIAADWYRNAEPVDSYGVSLAAGPRWRQSDFSHREFRRSFARDVLADGLDSFHSIQVAAVDKRPLPFAWITGTFTLQGLRAVFPRGVATLDLKDHDGLPCAFRRLCKLMQGEPITMPTGDWYVGKSSVDLKVDDGLV
jgi:4-carboxymuconolactone decarboxylase